MPILLEELGEANRALLEKKNNHYREEMVQVAAVAVAMIECFDRQVIHLKEPYEEPTL